MFTLFFFFVSLVFINLLNAYAVANVQKIESMAETSNQINRIETVLFFERFIQTTLKALGRFGRRKWVCFNLKNINDTERDNLEKDFYCK